MTIDRKHTILMLVMVAALWFVAAVLHMRYMRTARHTQVCTGCANKPGMLPVMDPVHNIEQAYTNIALLEDHMLPGKTCEDCCLKHFRLISGLIDEGISLDTHDRYGHVLVPASSEIRKIEDAFFSGKSTPIHTSKSLRSLRKKLTPFLKDRYKQYLPSVDGPVCSSKGCSSSA
jgi:hypothetical protein